MQDYGFKIAQEGFDVPICEDKDLVMSSEFDMLKTAATGVVNGGDSVSHGLAYTPLFFSIDISITGKAGFVGDDGSYVDTTVYKAHIAGYQKRYYLFYQPFE